MQPLAERLRPKDFADVLGQLHLCGDAGVLKNLAAQGRPLSLVLWGPAGTGKTTIARLLAEKWDVTWESISAITSGVADLKKRFEGLRQQRRFHAAVFFIDEIHHFNRSQQDLFLPYLEDGTIVVIGATTQNPSFSLNPALLSRMQVYTLNPLCVDDLKTLIHKAERCMGRENGLCPEVVDLLCAQAEGDARVIFGMMETLESLAWSSETPLTVAQAVAVLGGQVKGYERTGEDHYNYISLLHKAIRGSDVDGALYWLARMLVRGEDPAYICRRLVRCASEDIGLADPSALLQALAAWQAYERLGSPDGEISIVQAVIYLASAPKSNALYLAEKQAKRIARETSTAAPPMHGLNAPTKMMGEMGYGANYHYDHDTPLGCAGQSYFPPDVRREAFYKPVERGFEREILKRLQYWEKLRDAKG